MQKKKKKQLEAIMKNELLLTEAEHDSGVSELS